jgi:transposase
MSTKSKQLDFTGQNIYVGIDTHKKSFTVSIEGDRLFYKTFTQPPMPELLVDHLRKNYPGANYYAAYEAGFCGFWIQRQLEKLGIKCIVANPCDIPTTDKEKKQKRDSLDSRKLARCLKNGELRAIHVPNTMTQQDRSLLRTRERIIGNQTRCRNRIKALLHFSGITFPEQFEKSGTHWSKRFIKWLTELTIGYESDKEALNLLLKEANSLRALVLEADKGILKLSKEARYVENAKLLLTIPGIGRLTAMILLTEIEDIKRFKGRDDLCSYIGLIPNVYSSGETERVGYITKRGNSHLRSLIIESSWTAVRNDPALGCKYHELCNRMAGNKAIIRIARKLVNRIRYVLLNKEEYELAIAA